MLLENKAGIIFGAANRRSIAWAVARALAGAGARLALTFHHPRHKASLDEMSRDMAGALVLPCDVTNEGDARGAFESARRVFGRLDFLVHSVAYAPREALAGEFLQTTREAFLTALDVSVYSLTLVARAAAPLMGEGGSIVTMTYYGAEKVVTNYNVMGVAKAALESSVRYLSADLGKRNIRINALSPGPLNTVSGRGVAGMAGMLKHHAERAPLGRNVASREVADAALFLCSPLSAGVTGEVVHVDCGYNVMGM